jgi:hypothetical protein
MENGGTESAPRGDGPSLKYGRDTLVRLFNILNLVSGYGRDTKSDEAAYMRVLSVRLIMYTSYVCFICICILHP